MAQPADDKSHDKEKSSTAASIRWDISGLASLHCNLANATRTREGVILSFGEARERSRGELEVTLRHQVLLDAVAAQRLQHLLTKLSADYDARYGRPDPRTDSGRDRA